MKYLQQYIRRLIVESLKLPVVPPPEESLQELEKVIKQYYNRYNPDELQFHLDENMAGLFDNLLIQNNLSSKLTYINQLKKQCKPTVMAYKKYFNRSRPSQVADMMDVQWDGDEASMNTVNTSSYPSGHAVQAYYIAHHLSALYPQLKKDFFNLAEMVAQSRVDRGVHFPSDLEAGRTLALHLYKQKK